MSEPLTKAELAVMSLLWQRGDRVTAREIRETLYADSARPQHGTVQKLLANLETKRAVIRDKRAGTHFFKASMSRQTYAGRQLELLAEGLTSGSFAPLITHLIENDKISIDEIDNIIASLRTGRMGEQE